MRRLGSRRLHAYLPWSGNPLMRRGDRVVGIAVLFSALLALAFIPLCAWAGDSTYQSVTARADTATQVTARVVHVAAGDPTTPQSNATVSWVSHGVTRTDSTPVPRSTHDGESMTIWTAPDGSLVPDPPGGFERVLCAVWVALLAWGAALVALAGLVELFRRRVTRQHAILWDQEWQAASEANGWASR